MCLAQLDPESLPRVMSSDEVKSATVAEPGQLPGDELFDHVQYDGGSDEAFLRRLWRDLYGDEPVTGSGLRPTS